MNKEYWITWRRFIVIAIALLIIFFTFMTLLYLKADEITRDPCSICAENMGEQVTCTTQTFIPIKRIYYPNGSIGGK